MKKRLLFFTGLVVMILLLSACSVFERFTGSEEVQERSNDKDGVDTIGKDGGRIRLRDYGAVLFREGALGSDTEVAIKPGTLGDIGNDLPQGYELAGGLFELFLSDADAVEEAFEISIYMDFARENAVVIYVGSDGVSEIIEGELDDDEIEIMADKAGWYGVFVSDGMISETADVAGSDSETDSNDSADTEDAAKGTDDNHQSSDTDSGSGESVEGDEANEDMNQDSDGHESADADNEDSENDGETDGQDQSDISESEGDSDANSTVDSGTTSDTATVSGYTRAEIGGTFIGAYTDELFEYLPETHEVTTIFTTGEGYSVMQGGINTVYPVFCVSEDSRAMNGFFILNINDESETVVEVGETPMTYEVEWSPNGEYLAIATGEKLYIYKHLAGTIHEIVDGNILSIAWSSDSSGLLYTTGDGQTARLMVKVMGQGVTEVVSFPDTSNTFTLANTQGNVTSDMFFALTDTTAGAAYKGYMYDYGIKVISEVSDETNLNSAYFLKIGVMEMLVGLLSPSVDSDFPRIVASANPQAKWIHVEGFAGALFNNDLSNYLIIGDCEDYVITQW